MWNKINQSRRLRRCGGSFIKREGRLYRVAQDCNSVLYGKRMFMVPIEEMSPTKYREGNAILLYDRRMPPYNYCHTYNEIYVDGKRLSVVDVHRDSFKWPHQIVVDVVKGLLGKFVKRV